MDSNILFVAVFVLLILTLLHKWGARSVFYLMAALLPATGFFVDVGISLSASKIIGLILCMVLLKKWLVEGVSGTASNLGILFFLYAGFIAVIGTVMAPSPMLESPEFRVFMRPFVQWLSLILQMMPMFLAPFILRTQADVGRVVIAFFVGIGLLAVGGVAQWGIHRIWDVNIFPIYREGLFGDILEFGHFELGDEVVFRANSLAREPKDLGAALAIALVLWLLLRAARVIRSLALSWITVGVLFVALVLTFSTTAFFLLAIGLGFVTLSSGVAMGLQRMDAIKNQRVDGGIVSSTQNEWPRKMIVSLILIVIVGEAIALRNDNVMEMIPSITDVFELRVLDRVGEVEDYDQVTIDFLMNEPEWAAFGVGAGNLPLFAYSYLPGDVEFGYMVNLTWNAKSGFLAFISSFGFPGLLLFAAITIGVLRMLVQSLRRLPSEWAHFIVSVFTAVVFIVTVHALHAIDEILWLALGLAMAQGQICLATCFRSQEKNREGIPGLILSEI